MSIEEQIAREAWDRICSNAVSNPAEGQSIILDAIKRAVAIEREIVAIDAKPPS